MANKFKFDGFMLFVLLLFSTYYNFIFIEQNKDAFKALKYIRLPYIFIGD